MRGIESFRWCLFNDFVNCEKLWSICNSWVFCFFLLPTKADGAFSLKSLDTSYKVPKFYIKKLQSEGVCATCGKAWHDTEKINNAEISSRWVRFRKKGGKFRDSVPLTFELTTIDINGKKMERKILSTKQYFCYDKIKRKYIPSFISFSSFKKDFLIYAIYMQLKVKVSNWSHML